MASNRDLDVTNPESSKNIGGNVVDNLSSLVNNINIVDDNSKIKTNSNNEEQVIKNCVVIPEWLKEFETPFAWHLQEERGLGPDQVILRTLEKLDELLIEEPEFSFQRFVSLSKLVLEYYIIGDIKKCCDNMKIMEGCLEEEISREEPLYQKVKLSLGHFVSATKAHVLYIIGKEDESKKMARDIIPIKIMADTDKAALSCMKARFFLYSGYENGEEIGVRCARIGLELEPDNAEWEFLLAKMLRQQRKDVPFSSEVPRDELKLLESAVAKKKDPNYLAYLAQVYRECSSQAFRQYRNHPNFHEELKPSIERMAEKSLEYYKEALAANPDSPALLRRVGYGIMNLPKKFADYDLALRCLNESLEISENQMTLHVLGTFYHRYRNDNRKALEYFERTAKGGSHAGLSDMIRVKYILDREYDPVPDFEVGLSWQIKRKQHMSLLIQLGGYFLFIKRDLHKALEYFKQVILEDKDSPLMKSFKSFFLRMNEPIDLYKYLVNEAFLVLAQQRDSSGTLESEESTESVEKEAKTENLGYAEDFLDLISEAHPELMEMTPDSELIPRLIQTSREIEASWNQNNKRGGFRGRGGGWSGNSGGSRGGRGYERRGRGRFPGGNQREGEPGGDERRGRFYRGRGNNQNRRPRNNEDNSNKREQENWRKRDD